MEETKSKSLKPHWNVCLIGFFVFVLFFCVRKNLAPVGFILFVLTAVYAVCVELWQAMNEPKKQPEEAKKAEKEPFKEVKPGKKRKASKPKKEEDADGA